MPNKDTSSVNKTLEFHLNRPVTSCFVRSVFDHSEMQIVSSELVKEDSELLKSYFEAFDTYVEVTKLLPVTPQVEPRADQRQWADEVSEKIEILIKIWDTFKFAGGLLIMDTQYSKLTPVVRNKLETSFNSHNTSSLWKIIQGPSDSILFQSIADTNDSAPIRTLTVADVKVSVAKRLQAMAILKVPSQEGMTQVRYPINSKTDLRLLIARTEIIMHELKQPLVLMKGYSGMIGSTEWKNIYDVIEKRRTGMHDVIRFGRDLLMTKYEPVRTDMLARAFELSLQEAGNRDDLPDCDIGIAATVAESEYVLYNDKLMGYYAFNIWSNFVKAIKTRNETQPARAGEQPRLDIRFSIERTSESEAYFVITATDNGIGFSREMLASGKFQSGKSDWQGVVESSGHGMDKMAFLTQAAGGKIELDNAKSAQDRTRITGAILRLKLPFITNRM